MLGGVGKVLEVDEAVFARRKYHRGRAKKLIWVLGIAERATCKEEKCKLIMKVVPNRKAETLLAIIKETCLPFSTIYSDEFRSYCGLSELEGFHFTHHTVCHKKEFKSMKTGACTNTVEGMWHQVRGWLPGFWMKRRDLNDYLWSFLRKHNAKNTFENFLISHDAYTDEVYDKFEKAVSVRLEEDEEIVFEEETRTEEPSTGEMDVEIPEACVDVDSLDEDDLEDYCLFVRDLKEEE
jgi:transposase-like protein